MATTHVMTDAERPLPVGSKTKMRRRQTICLGVAGILWMASAAGSDGSGVMATLLSDGWKHRVYGIYPVEKLKGGELPEIESGPATIAIEAARGEYESFLIVVRGDVPLREVEVSLTDVRDAAGRPLGGGDVFRIGYIHVDEPSGSRIDQPMPFSVGTGDFPDVLLRGSGSVRPGRNLQFLVTVGVPRDAAAGPATGHVRLSFRREPWMPAECGPVEIPLTLTVRDFALPSPSPLLNTAHANLRALPPVMRTPELLGRWHDQMSQDRQVPDPLGAAPALSFGKDGAIRVDATAWEAAAERCLGQGGTHLFLPVWGFHPAPPLPQGLYFLHHFPAVTRQKWCGATICNDDRTLTPEFEAAFGSYLRQMHAVLVRRGWLDRTFITTMDEPYANHTGNATLDVPEHNHEVIRNFVALVRREAPGLRTFCTTNPTPALLGHIDHWCLRDCGDVTLARTRADQCGDVFTFCDNYRTFIDYPAEAPRSLGWVAWHIGARGWLTFETLTAFQEPWEPVFVYPRLDGGTVWGLGHLFHPAGFDDPPTPTLRWSLMRDGAEDYEYLWTLARLLESRPDAEAREFLATVAADIIPGGDAEARTQTGRPEPPSQRSLHARRRAAAQWIERLGRRP
jgi:hypothetical protein